MPGSEKRAAKLQKMRDSSATIGSNRGLQFTLSISKVLSSNSNSRGGGRFATSHCIVSRVPAKSLVRDSRVRRRAATQPDKTYEDV